MNGNLVGGFNIPNRKVANGVWGVNEVAGYTKQGMWPTANDPSFSSVAFLLHGDAVLATGNPLDITGNSDVQWYSTSAGRSGKLVASPFFPNQLSFNIGSGLGTLIAAKNSGQYSLGTQDFTIDFLAYPSTVVNSVNAFDMHSAGGAAVIPLMGWDSGKFYYFVNGAYKIQAFVYSTNTPYLITYNRTASTGTLFVNGSSVGTWADTSNYISSPTITCGGSGSGSANASGSTMDEFRLTIGVARNPSTYFNTASQPLLQRFPDR